MRCCIYISFFFLVLYILKYINAAIKILAVMFSCDRNILLNNTLESVMYHIKKYERNIDCNFHFVDSGTAQRHNYVKRYNLKNTFFMNPTDPEYSYKMFWSYLHGSFVLFLEDDRPFIKNIEGNILHKEFIEEAILILKEMDIVKGILLKGTFREKCVIKSIKTKLGNHIVCIRHPNNDFYYSNGPSIYKIKDLLHTGDFKSEYGMGILFKMRKWYTGFTYKGIECINNTLTSVCQTISLHLGENSTKGKTGICKRSIY